jgi:hypothetical protein
MTPKVSGPSKNSQVRTVRPRADGGRPRFSGPELAFAGATLAGFAAWVASSVTLPPGLIMPVVATVFLAFAAVLAMVAWRREMDPDHVTYADVAGALTLIGVCAAATIDPDQLVRLVEGGRTEH